MLCKIISTVIVALMVVGCSHNSNYRGSLSIECIYTTEGDCEDSARQISKNNTESEYRLGFIEYDDQGQLRQRGQQDSVIDNYLAIAGQQDVIVITFVHGWHHSAKPEDTNIKEFRTLLASVSKIEAENSTIHKRDRRPVLGVYIGWRGDSIDIDYLNMVTFWDRKSTAHKVGQQGVTEALLKLEELVNVRNTFEDGNPQSTSRFVVIGHSFGGAVVFSSLQKILSDRYIDSRKTKNYQGQASGFGDLVVLINPAFEALRFSALLELSQDKCRGYQVGQLPKLAILTSQTDYATKLAFPLGRMFSTFFESHSTMRRHECQGTGVNNMKPVDIAQGSADRSAVGHFEQYQTHLLKAAGEGDDSIFDLKRAYSDWSASDTTDVDVYSSVTLISKGRTTPRNPYMNIEVAEDLMDGHNDIWGGRITEFIIELITVSVTPIQVFTRK